MADKPTKIVVDCSTGISTEVELTDEEIAANAAMAAEQAEAFAAQEAAAAATAALKESAKAKLVAGTPLTEEEAAVLVL